MSTDALHRPAVAIGAITFTAFLWGSVFPLTTALLPLVPAPWLAASRYIVAVPTLMLFCVLSEQSNPFRGSLPWRHIVPLGAFGVAGFSMLVAIGIGLSDPVTAAMILASSPVVAAIMGWLMYGRRLVAGTAVAIVLSVIGCIVVTIGAARSHAGASYGGEILLLIGQFCWVWYSLKLQQWLAPLGFTPLRATALTTLVGGMTCVVIAILATGFGLVRLPALGSFATSDWVMFVWLGVLGTGMSTALWNFCVRELGVQVASIYGNLTPLFAVLISAQMGSAVTLLQILGGALILGGVLQLQLRRAPAAGIG